LKNLVSSAMHFLNIPYLWGGDDFSGYDCSGLVQEILAMVGADPPGDQTAQALFNHFSQEPNYVSRDPQAGAVVFFGSNHKSIIHVGFMIDKYKMIEAAGGGSHITSTRDAVKFNAYVKIRPIKRRKDLLAILMPDYDNIHV
jgi:cell wall-associated NlpC family hydrolase